MKKILLALALMLATSAAAYAQELRDTVYFHDGSIIYGKVLEYVPNGQLMIRMEDGSVFTRNAIGVDSVCKAPAEEGRKHRPSNVPFKRRRVEKGFKGFVEAAFSGNLNDSFENRGGMNVSFGSQIWPHLYIGGGFGFEFYGGPSIVTVPTFADIRANILNTPITPFVSVKVGYTIIGQVNGLYFNPMLGLRVALSNNLGLHLAVGYVMQKDKDKRVYTTFDTQHGHRYIFETSTLGISSAKIQFGFEF